ncbi:MAG: L-threonylcarbamoyladenylate synthase [Nitrospinota bacterium]
MKRLKYEPTLPCHRILEQACEVLAKGGIIVYPTDTIYGLGCSIFSEQAVRRVYKIKGRDSRNPMSIICSGLEDISKFATVPNFAFRLMKRSLPGPYTFILESSKEVPKYIRSTKKTVGIRVPDHTLCLALVKKFGHPIITTSVNISGEAPLNEPDIVEDSFEKDIDLLVDSGMLTTGPSTVVDCSKGSPEILRHGEGDLGI